MKNSERIVQIIKNHRSLCRLTCEYSNFQLISYLQFRQVYLEVEAGLHIESLWAIKSWLLTLPKQRLVKVSLWLYSCCTPHTKLSYITDSRLLYEGPIALSTIQALSPTLLQVGTKCDAPVLKFTISEQPDS